MLSRAISLRLRYGAQITVCPKEMKLRTSNVSGLAYPQTSSLSHDAYWHLVFSPFSPFRVCGLSIQWVLSNLCLYCTENNEIFSVIKKRSITGLIVSLCSFDSVYQFFGSVSSSFENLIQQTKFLKILLFNCSFGTSVDTNIIVTHQFRRLIKSWRTLQQTVHLIKSFNYQFTEQMFFFFLLNVETNRTQMLKLNN